MGNIMYLFLKRWLYGCDHTWNFITKYDVISKSGDTVFSVSVHRCSKCMTIKKDNMKTFFRHSYFAIRYGEWYIGWDKTWLTNPEHTWLYCDHMYYDGNYAAVRIGKFYVSVSY